ncbi:MAG: isoprenylcysteine carboxylmethyltransferase family protein [Spirochaetales bacterium]|nr:isoprenylcysteine carboxylmethyltransferase family protein [Spirochaetales bacterium]
MSNNNNQVKKSGILYIIRVNLQLIILMIVYFIAAGNLSIVRSWIFFGIAAISYLVGSILFIKYNPDLINERAEARENTQSWDKVLVTLYLLIGFLGTYIVAGLDYRFKWSMLPIELMIPGFIIYILGVVLGTWAMVVNRYFEATVRIQEDRGQKVIKDGPYKIVRHPGYTSVLLNMIGIPMMIGSLYAFSCTVAVFIIYFIRTSKEDKFLQEGLPGYSEYARETRYKLIPGIW